MNKNIDFDKVLGAANNLVGTLDLLASLYATAAANDNLSGESKSLAATFALLHSNALSLAELLTED